MCFWVKTAQNDGLFTTVILKLSSNSVKW